MGDMAHTIASHLSMSTRLNRFSVGCITHKFLLGDRILAFIFAKYGFEGVSNLPPDLIAGQFHKKQGLIGSFLQQADELLKLVTVNAIVS